MAFVYILYSKSADRFYVGSTSLEPYSRLLKHLSLYYGNNKFTAKYKDWSLFYWFECDSLKQAFHIEKHIKRMKSKNYIKNLKRYPQIHVKLLVKFRK